MDERRSCVARLLGKLTQPLLNTHARLPFKQLHVLLYLQHNLR